VCLEREKERNKYLRQVSEPSISIALSPWLYGWAEFTFGEGRVSVATSALQPAQATQNAERLATTFNFAGYFKHPSNYILM